MGKLVKLVGLANESLVSRFETVYIFSFDIQNYLTAS